MKSVSSKCFSYVAGAREGQPEVAASAEETETSGPGGPVRAPGLHVHHGVTSATRPRDILHVPGVLDHAALLRGCHLDRVSGATVHFLQTSE